MSMMNPRAIDLAESIAITTLLAIAINMAHYIHFIMLFVRVVRDIIYQTIPISKRYSVR